jgi:RecB family exonuclease
VPVHLLFGRTRWARRRGVAALLRGRRDAAYVMGTWRKREQLLRELAATPTGSTRFVEPAAWVFHHLAEELVRRFVDDRAPLPDGAALAVARRWVAERRDPGLGDDLATAQALLEATEAWSHAGRVPDDPRTRGWVLGLTAALDALPDHRRPAARLRRLLAALRDPSPGLRAWLGRHPVVVIDDLCGSSTLESAVVAALCAAWSDAGATVVLSFAVGRDRGGREIAWALGVEPPEDREATVFSATRALRSAVFEELVASGLADCWTAGPLGVREVDPVDEEGPGAPPDLADHVAAGIPLGAPLPAGGVTAGAFPDPESECAWVAATLASLLADGLDPRDALVAVGDPSVEPTLARILDDHGVPWRRGGGTAPGPVPAVRAAAALLGVSADGWPLDDVLSLAAFAAAGEPSLGARLRAAGVRSGDVAGWEPALRSWAARAEVDLEGLLRDRDAVAGVLAQLPPRAPATGSEWGARLRAAWRSLRPPEPLAAAIDGLFADLARDLAVAHPGAWDAALVRELVDHRLAGLALPAADDGAASVPVVDLREILGLTPRYTFLVGLRAGAWAAPRARGPLTPERGVGREALAEARYLLHSLLRDAVGDPWMRGVHLSWPAAVDGRPQRPAPLLAEVLELRVGSGQLGDHLRPPAPPLLGTRSGDRRAAARRAEDPVAAVARARSGPPGPHDGVLGHPVPSPGSLPVTTLETYLRCPHRYWVRQRLGLDVLPSDDPELEPRRRGTALHRILETFLRERDLRPPAADPEPTAARRALHAAASRVLDEVEREGGFDPLFHGYARARWLAGLVDDRPAGLLRAWLDQEQARVGASPEGVERPFRDLAVGPITLRGALDRVDLVGASGARLVIDYKTGRPPTREQVLAGLSLQPFAYLATVPGPAAACFQVLTRPDRLVRSTFVGDAAALDAACTPTERRTAREVTADERALALDAAGHAAEALLRGEFPPTPHEPALAGCPACPYRTACRRDLRHAAG